MPQETTTTTPNNDGPALMAEVERVRSHGVLGQNSRLSQLFDFLLERSLQDAPPKEAEIVASVFAQPGRSTPDDSVARVYVHRLRKRLESYYMSDGKDNAFHLNIPKGEYRLLATPRAQVDSPKDHSSASPGWLDWRIAAAAVLGILLLGNVLAWSKLASEGDSRSADLQKLPAWNILMDSERPLVVAVGDYYMFGEYEDRLFLKRLIRDFSINSKEDLAREYLTSPNQYDRFADVALEYLPTSTAYALTDLAPLFAERSPRVILASELTPNDMKTNDILYVGLISGLGPLKEPVFTRSRFMVGESYDEILDQTTGASYISEAFRAAPSDSMYRDYALFHTFTGPTGNQFAILAGARDTALMGLAETLTQSDGIKTLADGTANAASLEVLYEVQGHKHVNLEARIMAWGEINSSEIWSSAPGESPVFPLE